MVSILLGEPAREPVAPADDREPDARMLQPRTFDHQIAVEERHQSSDFRRRPLPVVCGERVEGEDVDAERRRCFHDRADAAARPVRGRRARTAERPPPSGRSRP